MGIEQLIPGDQERNITEYNFAVANDPAPNEIQQVIINDVAAHGLSRSGQLIGVVDIDENGIVQVSISDIPERFENAWGVDMDLTEWGWGPNTFIRLCHCRITAPDNPLELHWRWQQGNDPKTNIEGVERVKKTSEAVRYAAELCRLLPKLSGISTGRGRPADLAESERIVAAAEQIRNRTTPRLKWLRVAQEMRLDEDTLRYHREQTGAKPPRKNRKNSK